MKTHASGLMSFGAGLWLLASGLMPVPAFADQHHMEDMGHSAQRAGDPVTHQGVGKVVAVDSAALTVRLAHQAIKSLGWPGMTMDFRVASASVLRGIKAGDTVVFELGQGGEPGEWLVTRITPQSTKPAAGH